MNSARSTRSLAMAFVLGALLVGGVLGFTADRVLGRDDACSRYFTRSELRNRFADRLELTAAQRVKIDSILDARRAAVDSIEAPVKQALAAVSDSTARRITAVLDPEQRVKFTEMRADRDRRDKADSVFSAGRRGQ
jgi:Spy/CpxP family protein refolding chaperone